MPVITPVLYALLETATRKERIAWKLAVADWWPWPWLCVECPSCECCLPPQLTLRDAYWRDGEE